MEVILIEKVKSLGSIGDKVNVKGGYGRNFLIPKGMAIPANKKNIERFEAQRAELEKKSVSVLATANERASKLNALAIEITGKAGDEGKLYGSIGARDIAEAISIAGVTVAKHEVQLPDGPLRNLGEFDISLNLHAEVASMVKIRVVAA